MYPFLFTGLAFACAGGLCALIGDLQKRMYLGLASFMAVNAVIWGRFIYAVMTPSDLLTAAALFLLSHVAATCAYLAMVYFLDTASEMDQHAMAATRD